ncbi:MAG TPA: hypothetical protein VI035_02315 [Solirubrobacterales bacterium]
MKKWEKDHEHASPHVKSMMRIDPQKPGLLDLLRGEGEPAMRVLAWAGVFVLLPLFIAGGLTALGL